MQEYFQIVASFDLRPTFKAHLERSCQQDRNGHIVRHRRVALSTSSARRGYDIETDDKPFDYTRGHLLGSSNGLVCVSRCRTQILVVNPATREVRKLRYPQISKIGFYCWGFGYSSSIDDYMVVLGFRKGMNLTCFQMLTLKSNSWKIIREVNYTCLSRMGILCNGALHWVAYHNLPQSKDKVFLSFDLSKENFKEVPQPDDKRYKTRVARHPTMRLGSINDCLCVFRRELLPSKLWMMKNYNEKQSWRRVEYDHDTNIEAVHMFKELKHYIPNKRSLCHTTWFIRTLAFIGTPRYVESLVSPHVSRRRKRKRQAMSNMRSG